METTTIMPMRRIALFLLSILLSIILIPVSVRANPIIYFPAPEWSLGFIEGWLTLVAANFPINLFWYSLSLWINGKIWGMRMGDLPWGSKTFLLKVFIATLLITSVGAVIDILFILFSFKNIDTNFFSIAIGICLIFASVVLVSKYVFEMKKGPRLVSGIILAIINPIFWGIQIIVNLSGPRSSVWLLPTIFLLPAIVAVIMLFLWHKKANADIPTRA